MRTGVSTRRTRNRPARQEPAESETASEHAARLHDEHQENIQRRLKLRLEAKREREARELAECQFDLPSTLNQRSGNRQPQARPSNTGVYKRHVAGRLGKQQRIERSKSELEKREREVLRTRRSVFNGRILISY